MKNLNPFRIVLVAVLFGAIYPCAYSEEVSLQTLGDALAMPVVDIFVPPTRSENPYVATAEKVYSFDPASSSWVEVFDAGSHISVVAIEGYEKSSAPLYVATSAGIARTRDGGENWAQTKPSGYSIEQGFGGLSVNPANRKEALVAAGDRAWYTVDYGDDWSPLPLPEGITTIGGVSYAQHDPSVIILWDSTRLYWTRSLGQRWSAFDPAPQKVSSVSVSEEAVHLLFADTSSIASIDIKTFASYSKSDIDMKPGNADVLVDNGKEDGFWLATDAELFFVIPGIGKSLAYKGAVNSGTLAAHPRKNSTLYFAKNTAVMRVENPSLTGQSKHSSATPFEALAMAGQIPASEVASANASNNVMRQILASEPPLRVAVQAAVQYADFDSSEVREWRHNVKRRNWLPELHLDAGKREYPLDLYETVNPGTPLVNDLHLSDEGEYMDYVGVELRWNFGNLLFDKEQTKISSEARERSASRNDLIRLISEIYYERIKVLVKLRSDSKSLGADDKLTLSLQALESTDLLNQLCGKKVFSPPIL